ncbi:MAG TPA: FAD-binding monooxygenase [Pusillimonas sp.]|uniref:FAD-binding monooxygenase n=1 Tax=unclassified Pusillimonas TaxID=2640016 RepID=UPI00262897CE|nr:MULTISPECIES: FAD-binding monooxygenase [unclassified Pusillimonas]HLU20262.1 FAD-binding monooxygenase [Pusillimonas sp.]
MQFYLNGYRFGDPEIHDPAPGFENPSDQLPETVDVLIVGSGPAGLILSAQLSSFPGFTTRIIERREGPLQLGHADGVASRTVEMLDAFGLATRLVREACWITETVFWRPDENNRTHIRRTGRVDDAATELSEMPHVIVNQARLQQYLLQYMENSPTRLKPDYGLEVVKVEVGDSGEYPVTVTMRPTAGGPERTIRARYVVGTDGARSVVRTSIGRELHGDIANHAWGVMDILAVTDFPDIRIKAAIQSADEGNILLIPREGGYLVRLYVDLGVVDPARRDEIRNTTADQLIDIAQKVLHPYTLEVKNVVWSSVYEVGQRVADKFDDVPADRVDTQLPRVFIAGDACHTHSAKAGQGMNVSMQDTFNLGWKLIAVLQGRAHPSLLHTYSAERQPVAKELIDFDKEWSAIMGSPPKDPLHPERGGVDPAELQEYFVRSGQYTAGLATHYPAGPLFGTDEHQALAKGYTIGMRFHSAPVVQVADAKPVHLGHVHRADGAWRLYAFADADATKLNSLMNWLSDSDESPVRRYTPAGADPDSIIDVRAIYQQPHHEIAIDKLPAMLLPRKGRFGLIDYEKVFSPDPGKDNIFDLRGVDRTQGAMVLVRPDQYVAHVLPLDAHDTLAAFFARFMLEPRE